MAGKTCRITVTNMNGMAHSISDYGRDFVRSCFLGDHLPSRPQRALNGSLKLETISFTRRKSADSAFFGTLDFIVAALFGGRIGPTGS
jgi:hypothetical protein